MRSKEEYYSKFNKDTDDAMLWIKEFLVVLWRHNPAGIIAVQCNQLFDALCDDTPRDHVAAMVQEVMQNVEFPSVENFEEEYSSNISKFSRFYVDGVIEEIVKVYPKIEDFLKGSIDFDDLDFIEASFKKMIASALSKERSHYEMMYAHYNQLIENLPRYMSIMTKSDFWSGVMNFAAGFFGGGIGVVGAEIWNNWSSSNDNDFCSKFGNAFEAFAQESYNYVVEIESKLNVVFDRMVDELKNSDARFVNAYMQLYDAGWDLAPLYKATRYTSEPVDEDMAYLSDLAISNLEENSAIHFRSIENIRDMMNFVVEGSPPPLPRN